MSKHRSIINRILSKAVGVKIPVGIQLYYENEYGSLDFEDNDLPNWRAVLAVAATAKFILNKTGANINGDGNIDTSADGVLADKKLLSVEINGEPDFAQHFYSKNLNLVYGFDTSTSSGATITITFI